MVNINTLHTLKIINTVITIYIIILLSGKFDMVVAVARVFRVVTQQPGKAIPHYLLNHTPSGARPMCSAFTYSSYFCLLACSRMVVSSHMMGVH